MVDVELGMLVKVVFEKERFWARVVAVRAEQLCIEVDNELVHYPYKCGDRIKVARARVVETASDADCRRFLQLARKHGSAVKAALAWREERLASGAGAPPLDGGRPQPILLTGRLSTQ